ncbi:MAG: 2-oxoacid:acceptor oxidoreductase family protein [Candidatus Ranarchaeia archaeon]
MPEKIIEIRLHARAGQGAWTASRLLAAAALREGKHIQSFPAFGPERRGAPMVAFARISDHEIDLHCNVYHPDIVAVMDPSLLKTQDVTAGCSENTLLVVNSKKKPSEIREMLNFKGKKVVTVNATDIAIEKLGRAITNTAIIGAIVRSSDYKLFSLESLNVEIKKALKGKKLTENLEVVKRSYDEVRFE